MKMLKKIMSAVIASATLMAGTAFPVSADYSPYDVNRDGYIGVADLTPIIRYLAGVYSVTNYNQLDVNRNLVVDEADKECLTQILLRNTYDGAYYSREKGDVVSAPTVSGFTPSQSSSSTDSRTYRRCRFEKAKPIELSDYTLTPIEMGLNDGASPRGIIGTDDRESFNGPESSGLVFL